MSEKISIGLRGWRFDEDEVFTETGEVRPFDEISDDTRQINAKIVGRGSDDVDELLGDDE